jgi:soluble lytic murein transglycosylase-like protein
MFPARVARWAEIAEAAAERFGVPVEILLADIWSESNGDPQAESDAGAVGLMQLMPDTAADLGVADRTDPVANVMGGARYLSQLARLFDRDMAAMLAAYNWGPGNMQRRSGWPGKGWMGRLPVETTIYVPRVLERAGWHLSGELAVPPLDSTWQPGPGGGGGGGIPPVAALFIGGGVLAGIAWALANAPKP